jgi:hypothetical protein
MAKCLNQGDAGKQSLVWLGVCRGRDERDFDADFIATESELKVNIGYIEV